MAAEMQNDSVNKRMEEGKNNPVAAVYINADIIFVVLTLLPVITLLRFKSVCKSWYDLISDRRFVNAHIERSRRNPRVVVSPVDHNGQRNILLYFYKEGESGPVFLFKKQAPFHSILLHDIRFCPVRPVHCDGLLLVETPDEMFVCNPSIGEITTLPEGNQPLFHGIRVNWGNAKAGIGLVSGANAYKVARYFFRYFDFGDIHASTLGFEVFTLGLDSSWRVTSTDPPNQIHTCEDSPVSAGGAIYYKIHNQSTSFPNFQLFCFDLTCEEFTVIPVPSSLESTDYTVLGELEGTLCLFVDRSSKTFEVWKLLKDTWIPAFSVYLQTRPYFFWPYFFKPVQMQRGKLLLQIQNRLAYYDLRTKSMYNAFRTSQDFPYHDSFHAVSYVESLVSFGGTRLAFNCVNFL